jgi:hypothetical protein
MPSPQLNSVSRKGVGGAPAAPPAAMPAAAALSATASAARPMAAAKAPRSCASGASLAHGSVG